MENHPPLQKSRKFQVYHFELEQDVSCVELNADYENNNTFTKKSTWVLFSAHNYGGGSFSTKLSDFTSLKVEE